MRGISAFANLVVPMGTETVSSVLLPASAHGIDRSLSTTAVGSVAATPHNIVVLARTTPQRLHTLDAHISKARAARSAGDAEGAIAAYQHAYQTLIEPIDARPHAPALHRHLANGTTLLQEAFFGATALEGADAAGPAISALLNFSSHTSDALHSTAAEERAHLVVAYQLMQYAESTFEFSSTSLEHAVHEVRNLLENQPQHFSDQQLRNLSNTYDLLTEAREAVNAGQLANPSLFRKARKAIQKTITAHDIADIERLLPLQSLLAHLNAAASSGEPLYAIFRRSTELVNQALESVNSLKSSEQLEITFLAQLLKVEIASRQLVHAHHRRDFEARRSFLNQINDAFDDLASLGTSGNADRGSLSSEQRHAIVEYQADVAILLARLGLFAAACERARTVLELHDDTAAATRILEDDHFKPYHDGTRLLDPSEIAQQQRGSKLLKRLRATIACAHSPSTALAISSGFLGATLGIASNELLWHQPSAWGVAIGAVGAIAATIANRVIHGFFTEEAVTAGKIGVYERTPERIGLLPAESHALAIRDGNLLERDLLTVMSQGAIEAIPAALSGALLNQAMHALTDTSSYGETSREGFQRIANTGLNIGRVFGGGLLSVGHAVTTIPTLDQFLHGLKYTVEVGSLYGAGYLFLQDRELQQRLGWWPLALVPGLGAFAADLLPWIADRPFRVLECFGAAAFLSHLLFPKARKLFDKGSIVSAIASIALAGDINAYLSEHWAHKQPSLFANYGIPLIVSVEVFFGNIIMGLQHTTQRRGWKQKAKFYLWEANYSQLMYAAIVNSFTSVLGSILQGSDKLGKEKFKFDPSLIALQGVLTTIGVLPVTLGFSGIIKGQIPFVSRVREAFEETRDLPWPAYRRLYEVGMSAGSALAQPYTQNRVLRSFWCDVPGAMARTAAGWSTPWGQLGMSSVNFASMNGVASSIWPENSGSFWERDAFMKIQKDKAAELAKIDARESRGEIATEIADSLRKDAHEDALRKMDVMLVKTGQKMDAIHLVRDHAHCRDRSSQLLSLWHLAQPADVPRTVNPAFYASLHQMLHEGEYGQGKGKTAKLDAATVDLILNALEINAAKPHLQTIYAPLAQTLLMARESTEFGNRIKLFFGEHPEIPIMLGIDPETCAPPSDFVRRLRRKYVRRMIRTPQEEFQTRLSGFRRSHERSNLTGDLFQFRPPTPPQPPQAQQLGGTVPLRRISDNNR